METKKIIVFILLSVFFKTIKAQIHEVMISDTTVVVRTLGNVERYQQYYIKQGYLDIPPHDFKDNLSSGTWVIYRQEGKRKIIYAVGHYKNNLRDGEFQYMLDAQKMPQLIYNFKNGILDGQYISRIKNRKVEEGYYRKGKKDGFFMRYDLYTGNLLSVKYYSNDSLQTWEEYYNGLGVPKRKGYGEKAYLSGEYFEYDTLGNITKKEIYKDGKLYVE